MIMLDRPAGFIVNWVFAGSTFAAEVMIVGVPALVSR